MKLIPRNGNLVTTTEGGPDTIRTNWVPTVVGMTMKDGAMAAVVIEHPPSSLAEDSDR